MKILIISYWFLPSSRPNTKRPFYFAEAFFKEGWSADIVESRAGMTFDQEELLSDPNLNIRRIIDPANMFYRQPKTISKTMLN